MTQYRYRNIFWLLEFLGMVLVDFFRLPKVKKNNDKCIVHIPEQSLKFFNNSNGGIIMSGHIGNWEYIGPSLGINEINCSGVAKIQRNSKSNTFFNELRRSHNVKIIPVDAGSEAMINTIKKGNYLGLISDQNAGERGTKNYLFNAPTYTPKGAAFFNVKNNSPILYITITMRSDYTYVLNSKKLFFSFKDSSKNQKISDINEAYNK